MNHRNFMQQATTIAVLGILPCVLLGVPKQVEPVRWNGSIGAAFEVCHE